MCSPFVKLNSTCIGRDISERSGSTLILTTANANSLELNTSPYLELKSLRTSVILVPLMIFSFTFLGSGINSSTLNKAPSELISKLINFGLNSSPAMSEILSGLKMIFRVDDWGKSRTTEASVTSPFCSVLISEISTTSAILISRFEPILNSSTLYSGFTPVKFISLASEKLCGAEIICRSG